jgi:hypothetical protein
MPLDEKNSNDIDQVISEEKTKKKKGINKSPSEHIVPSEVVAAEDMFGRIGKRKNRGRVDSVIGGVDKIRHDSALLKLEWAIKYSDMSPASYLREIKGYSQNQIKHILELDGGRVDWTVEKNAVRDKLTESVVKRHIDLIAEVQEQHISASKLGLAKAIEMLAKLSIEPAKDKDGKIIVDAKGKIVHRGFRSIDLVNCMAAIEKAQMIYRKAMGLPNDEGGLQQILDKVTQVNIQNNITNIHGAAAPESEKVKELEKQLSVEDIMDLVKLKREMRKKEEAAGGDPQ